jgi:hypothetical protein
VARIHLTLLVEDLAALAAAATDADVPVLERCLARGRPLARPVANADELRAGLFAADDASPAPVGALTAAADALSEAGDSRYWLRVDPVTLTADMTRVFMTAHGLADVEEADRVALRECVADTLAEAGHSLLCGHPERWLLALDAAPPVDFMRLEDALGLDMAEALPGDAEDLEWRRLLTDIQVALHNADVNQRRRSQGLREINGAWIWGGGRLPQAGRSCPFDCVISDHPVSRGLAALTHCAPLPETAAETRAAVARGGEVLHDWRTGALGATGELERLERFVAGFDQDVARGRLAITLLDGGGSGWRLDRAALRRFWRRPRPLRERLSTGPGS